MTIIDDLAEMSQRLQCNVVLPLPPICRRVIEQAREAGMVLGTLYVVCRPLLPGVQGSYDRDTHDVWCHYDGSQGEEGQRRLVQCLLTLLAAMQQQFPVPQTIEDDWWQLSQSHQAGFTLAQQWGLSEYFAPSDMERLQAQDRYHYRCHLAAGELAGHLDPFVARSAYFALLDLREHYGWTDLQFQEALCGISEDSDANSQVVFFDRSPLRRRWLITHSRRENEPASFGTASVHSPYAAFRLRGALERAFEQRVAQRANLAPLLLHSQSSHWFGRATNVQELSTLVALLNTWLIDDEPQTTVRMHWWCYADESRAGVATPHLYRGQIAYEENPESAKPITRELWVLFGAPQTDRNPTIEAAWQCFVLSWLAFAELRCAPFADGLHELWLTFNS